MPELDSNQIEQAAISIFRDGKSIAELAEPYTVDELMRAFENLRRSMIRLLTGLSVEQINYTPDAGTYSLSEVVSHLITAQGNAYNGFIDISASQRPHIDPVPRGAGAGAEKGLTAEILIGRLQTATSLLAEIVHETYNPANATRVTLPGLGEFSQKGILLFQLTHDLDHLKQSQALRRSPTFPARRKETGLGLNPQAEPTKSTEVDPKPI